MARNDMRLYRLHVIYPDAALDEDGYPDPEWEPEGWLSDGINPYNKQDLDKGERPPFYWPVARIYRSRSGAEDRAGLLRHYGATVTVEVSDPVVWPSPEGQ